MKIAYLETIGGLAGDMLLSAFVDAGLPKKALREMIDELGLEDVRLRFRRVKRGVIAATQLTVSFPKKQPHRGLADIRTMIEKSGLAGNVKKRAVKVFTNLARAEAAVHGEKPSKVHFHEVGAVDALVDVVGAALSVEFMEIDRLYCSELPLGSGSVTCRHGVLPVPAPATMELVKGLPVRYRDDLPGERVTPTGAALAKTLVHSFGKPPGIVPEYVGYGAGSRTDGDLPNVVRLVIGQATDEPDTQRSVVVQANVDDMNPQLCETLTERLLTLGVHDVFYAPVTMKKGRPGIWINVICPPAIAPEAQRLMLAETSTLGIRSYNVTRTLLKRERVVVNTEYGPIHVKLGFDSSGELLNVHPEFDDCKREADRNGVPVKRVMQAAVCAYFGGSSSP